MFLTQEQIDKIKWLFYTPTTELSTEEMFEKMNQEFGLTIPNLAWSMYLNHIGLNLQSRPRKIRPTKEEKKAKETKQTIFEFINPDGTKTIIDLKSKEVTTTSKNISVEEVETTEPEYDFTQDVILD